MAHDTMPQVSRRKFLAGSSVAALTIAAASLSGCSQSLAPTKGGESNKANSSVEEFNKHSMAYESPHETIASDKFSESGLYVPEFLKAPDKISNISETKEYDIVVIGAGAAGIPCALAAQQAGAKVCLLQKEKSAVSQGNSGSGVIYERSDPQAVEALIQIIQKGNTHRSNRKLVEKWAKNSGEAINWLIGEAEKAGAQIKNQGSGPQHLTELNGGHVEFVTSFFGPKPYDTGSGMRDLAKYLEKEGVEIFYNTPGVQLAKEGDKVVGVIAHDKEADKYIQFNGTKGVVLACGDYQNDEQMVRFYVPDIMNFDRKQLNKTGDGHKMGLWAGGVIEPLNHTKMLHDFDAGPASMCDFPFLVVNEEGERFVNEETQMSLMNNYTRQEKRTGWYSQIFDSKYMEETVGWPGKAVSPKDLEVWMPDVDMKERPAVFGDLVRTFRCDTLEELADKLEIPKDAFVTTVKRYNEIVKSGVDEDFGKDSKFLTTVDTPPYYGIHRHLRVSAVCSGLVINEDYQVLNKLEGEPIEGLYAIGNNNAGFYGGVDYPLDVFGLSLGRCYTEGYLVGKALAAK